MGGFGGGAEDGGECSRRRIIAAWLFQDAGGTTGGYFSDGLTDNGLLRAPAAMGRESPGMLEVVRRCWP